MLFMNGTTHGQDKTEASMIKRIFAVSIIFFVFLLTHSESSAHLILAGYGSVNINDNKISILIGIPMKAFDHIDLSQNNVLSQQSIEAHKSEILESLNSRIKFTFNAPLEVISDDIIFSPPSPGDQIPPQLEWLRQIKLKGPLPSKQIDIELNTKALGQKYIFQLKMGTDQEIAVITDEEPKHQFFKDQWGTLHSFFLEGLSHILSGFDHLVFLLVLLIPRINIKRWLLVLSSFTVAHGLTYGLARQGFLSVAPTLVESIIALTIVITSMIEIQHIKPKLWQECLMVFAFGLFHGLGFASAMSTMTNESRFPLISIFGFNLGIEFGQLITALSVFLILSALKYVPFIYNHTPRVISICSGLIGSYWLIERLFF